MPSIVATIGTMSLFRGIAYGVLGDRVLKNYPADFAFFGQGYVAGLLSFELLLFAILRLGLACFCISRLPAGGSSRSAPIPTRHGSPASASKRYRFWLFVATGVASGIAAILLTSRLGSTRPSIAQGWELEIISMVILGGVSVLAGAGRSSASCSPQCSWASSPSALG